MKIGAAPVSWGICEVPGWGYQMPSRIVLGEMADVGMTASELGPPGFLPDSGAEAAALLATHGLGAIGAFAPIVLHRADVDAVAELEPYLDRLVEARAEIVVIAAASGIEGYDSRPELTQSDWNRLLEHLDLMSEVAAARGILAVIHPHIGTVVERSDEVARVLNGSAIPMCLDTGHLLIGGVDPVQLARDHGDRVAHVQFKDVDLALAGRVQAEEITYTEGVRQGMYRPLGQGDVDVAAMVRELAAHSYDGWLVLEQDRMLPDEKSASDRGLFADVQASVAFLHDLLDAR